MKNIIVIVLFTLSLSSFAQRRKTVFVEALGNGLLLSANFDLRLKPNQNDGLGFRAGIGGGSLAASDSFGNSANVGIVSVPLSVNYIVGKKRSGFESGLGITPVFVSAQANVNDEFVSGKGLTAAGFINVGYRFQPVKQGVMFRVNWAPAITNTGFFPSWFGLSLGYSFK